MMARVTVPWQGLLVYGRLKYGRLKYGRL